MFLVSEVPPYKVLRTFTWKMARNMAQVKARFLTVLYVSSLLGQILALAFREKNANPFKVFPLNSEAVGG